MKPINKGPISSDILRLSDDLLRLKGATFQTEGAREIILDHINESLDAKSNLIRTHGFRIQNMFLYVAAGLGGCSIINEEDSGEYFCKSDAKRPDFRVVTSKGEEFFVEVKNHHPKKVNDPYTLKADYLEPLQNYSRILNKELYIAIYWSRLKFWSLIKSNKFMYQGKFKKITFPKAMEQNELIVLGDCLVGTIPPLAVRFFTDPEKPRKIDENGNARFTIGGISIFANENEINDSVEKKIAWFLYHYGKWEEIDMPAQIEGNNLISFGWQATPNKNEIDSNRNFQMIGFLSQMISRKYDFLTAPEGEVSRLKPNESTESFGLVIPDDYKGEVLKLWRFSIMPKLEDIE